MEFLIGIILLLQVVVSIQIMLIGKQMLQRMEALEKNFSRNTEVLEEKGVLEVVNDEAKSCESGSSGAEKDRKNQEELLNEVLSEVFS